MTPSDHIEGHLMALNVLNLHIMVDRSSTVDQIGHILRNHAHLGAEMMSSIALVI